MRKKALAVMLCLCMAIVPVGCGKNDTTEGEQSNTTNTGSEGTTTERTTLEQKYVDGVTLGKYYGIEVEAATESEIEEYIAEALAYNTVQTEVTDRAVKDGDITVIDYAGFRGEEQFEGGTATDAELVIGSGLFIEGFEEGLIGAEIGKEVELNLKFPDDYHSEELAGAEVVFKVTVKKILEESEAELNDAFVQSVSDCKTVEEYRNFVKEDITNQKKYYAVRDEVVGNAEFALYPEESIARTSSGMMAQYEMYASAYGMDFDTFLASVFDLTQEQFKTEMDNYARELEEERMAFLKVAQVENLELTEEQYQEQAMTLAQSYGYESIEDFETDYTKEIIMESLLLEFALDNCVQNAVVVED